MSEREQELEPGSEADVEPGIGANVALDQPGWHELLEYLRVARGFDFHGYKPATLVRRIRRRMEQVDVADFTTYRDYLEVHPEEFGTLFNTILINVTAFFRDPPAWDVVTQTVIPDLVGRKGPSDPIRIWSAGSATGEEAYTLAIVLAEHLGIDDFRERVKIYATDVDDDALSAARQAVYSARQVEAMPPDLLRKYFEPMEDSFTFRKDLRRLVIFGRHDLLEDAPISRIDLLACRNVLMYFNAEAQARILARFHFALNDGGFLFLGRAETLMAHGQNFAPVDLKRRISRKTRGGMRERTFYTPAASGDGASSPAHPDTVRIREAALDTTPVAQIVLDDEGQVVGVNERARLLFSLTLADLGRPFQDLQLSYRPIELRSVLEQARADRRMVTLKDIEWRSALGDVRWFDLQVAVLFEAATMIGASVSFLDVTAFKRLQRELEQANQELETAYEELQSTNEELETTNEELQSTVEELETTNEELQSTNEELETMNEELQSTNEELQTINDELRERGDELNTTNAFLDSVLTSLQRGVAVVDTELRLLGWNRQAEELWGVRADEVAGRHLLNLDIGLPLDQVRPLIRASLSREDGQRRIVVPAVNRRGRRIECAVSCSPLLGADQDVRGVIILMDDLDGGTPGDDEPSGDGAARVS
jgi:two-component system CheB/CheR fusion protein